MHAEAMLLVDHREREVAEFDLFLEQRVGADEHMDVAEGELFEDVAALAAALPAGEDGDIDAGRGGERRDGVEMLPRQNLGRRHQRGLPAAFDHGRGGEQGDHGLARSHVALQQPQHALGLGEIGDDLGDRTGLRRRERVGQRLDQLFPDVSGAGRRPAGRTPQVRAHQRERELARQELVIGEPRPCRSLRQQVGRLAGPMQGAQRLGEGREALACDPARVLPFRQFRQARKRGIGGSAHLIEAHPLGQRVDRLDQRQLREIGLRDHAIGMHHLQHVVVERRPCPTRSAARRPARASAGSPCAH